MGLRELLPAFVMLAVLSAASRAYAADPTWAFFPTDAPTPVPDPYQGLSVDVSAGGGIVFGPSSTLLGSAIDEDFVLELRLGAGYRFDRHWYLGAYGLLAPPLGSVECTVGTCSYLQIGVGAAASYSFGPHILPEMFWLEVAAGYDHSHLDFDAFEGPTGSAGSDGWTLGRLEIGMKYRVGHHVTWGTFLAAAEQRLDQPRISIPSPGAPVASGGVPLQFFSYSYGMRVSYDGI